MSKTGSASTETQTAKATTMSAPLEEAAEPAIKWKLPDGGVAGAGFFGLKRLILTAPAINYQPGGFEVPMHGLTPMFVLGVSAKGGVDGYYNHESKKLELSRGGVEVNGTITDFTVVFIGN